MSYREILVHIKAYEGPSPHIEAAIAVAKSFDARLTALYTMRDLAMLKLILGKGSKSALEAAARDAPLAAEAEARFKKAAAAAGVEAIWQTAEGQASELLTMAGRYYDLVVIEQTRSGIDELGDGAEQSAITSGTPTLVMPHNNVCNTDFKHVVVAWNGSRQAGVALRGALPIIERAERVTVLTGEDRDRFSSVTKRPTLDIAAYVRRHAKTVEARPFTAVSKDAGHTLLNTVQECKGDLLVMGVYGRASWREFMFGGATQQVLDEMRVPILAGH